MGIPSLSQEAGEIFQIFLANPMGHMLVGYELQIVF